MKKHLVLLTILSIALFTSCKKNSLDGDSQSSFSNDSTVVTKTISGQFVPNELLIKFKAGSGEKSRTQTLSFINGKVTEHILTPAMRSTGDRQGIYLVNTTTDVFAAIARMKGESNIEFAEPNWIYTHTTISNDAYYIQGNLWGMYGTEDGSPDGFINPYGTQANKAWKGGNLGSRTVYIGIIDEGYMYTHEDLAPNIAKNPIEAAGKPGVDDDGNKLVDDIYGWDFANGDNSIFDGTSDDHGTHVAGTIGAIGSGIGTENNNRKGVVGVCWKVSLLNAKFLGQRGGTTANAIKAVDYFTDLKKAQGLNIVATNNSWGGGGYSTALYEAIERANLQQILFIAAAGNNTSDNDATDNYPSNYLNENIIAVASIEPTNGTLSYFSNWGATKVDLAAPGSGIYSTVPASSKGKIVSAYAKYSGTSMATPHVTGAAALYAASRPLPASAAEIKAAILKNVAINNALIGKCATGGHLNVSTFY